MTYRLAPMSAVMWVLTVALLAIPVVVVAVGLTTLGLVLAIVTLWRALAKSAAGRLLERSRLAGELVALAEGGVEEEAQDGRQPP